jgi:photosystem II stability/assembly factor-like uncharacterized protein
MKRPERGPRRRWAWWLITAAVAAGCSAAAFWQAPASNADSPPRGLGALFHPFERNAWLRLPRGQQVHGTATPVSVQALSGDEAWVGISDGSAVHTTDGGRSWRSVALPKPPGAALRVLRFGEGLRGWALYSDGALYTSYDAGGTWEQDRFEGARESRILGLAVSRDGKHAVCIGELAVWGWTPGKAWLRLADAPGSASKLPPPEFLEPVAVLPNGTHLAASFGQVVRGGAYGRGSEPLSGDLHPTALQLSPDGSRAWLTSEDGTIRALEGGTGAEQYRGDGPLYDLWMLDGARGWAVGANGQVVTTRDGATWQRAQQAGGATLTAIAMADDRRGWALSGASGRAFSVPGTDTVWRTEDGGETWHRRLTLSERFLAPTVGKDGIASVETSAGARLQSDDGGHGWTVAALGPPPKVAPKAKADVERQRCGARECTHRTVVDQTGWALDAQGLLVTRDGGRTWAHASTGFKPTALSGGKREGYPFFVATDGQALFFASSGGWEPVRYSWWPAPWYFLSLAVVALLVRHSIKAPALPKRESVADLLVSDKPIESITDDVLGIHELAQGMSRFIRNDQTQPSLTLAVSGEWGSGKSSLLNLLQADLRRFGYHPVWFNAWHHEQEENLIAALYAQIISQATPPFFSWESLTFRLRLLRRQRGKLSGIFMASLLLLTAGAGYFIARQERWLDVLERGSQTLEAVATFLSAPDEKTPEPGPQTSKYTLTFKQSPDGTWEGGVESVTPPAPAAPAPSDPPSQWIAAISALLGLLGVGRSVMNRLRAFGVDPARFAASLAGSDRPRDHRESVGFQSRFAKDFGDVTRALAPRRMVILVDDLDRCSPQSALKMLETINFLVTSGECFVVMAISERVIEEFLAVQFKDQADSLPGAKALPEHERRVAYARKYLEKLINIEVKLPPMGKGKAAELLNHLHACDDPRVAGEEVQKRKEVLAQAQRRRDASALASRVRLGLTVVMVVGLCLGAGLYGGSLARHHAEQAAAARAETDRAAAALAASKKAAVEHVRSTREPPKNRVEALLQAQAVDVALTSVTVWQLREPLPSPPRSWVFASAFWAVAALLLWTMRQRAVTVQDSHAFLDALKAWNSVISENNTTPRSVKKFLNRVRFYAMQQRTSLPEEQDFFSSLMEAYLTGAERGRRGLGRVVRGLAELARLLVFPKPEPVEPEVEPTIPEPLLVALAALSEADPALPRKPDFAEGLKRAALPLNGPLQEECNRLVTSAGFTALDDQKRALMVDAFRRMSGGVEVRD